MWSSKTLNRSLYGERSIQRGSSNFERVPAPRFTRTTTTARDGGDGAERGDTSGRPPPAAARAPAAASRYNLYSGYIAPPASGSVDSVQVACPRL
eukprot:COSAG03_NODE_2503_length_2693_cov_91.953354_4_plen_95_part_00